MKNDIQKNILANVQAGIDTYLIGQTNSGKTWFAEHELIPFLQNEGLTVQYFENGDKILSNIDDHTNAVIVDEAEILADRSFLEKAHPAEQPFYSPEYLNKVEGWHSAFRKIQQPAIYIITRNTKEEIENLIETIKSNEWNEKPVNPVTFLRQQ